MIIMVKLSYVINWSQVHINIPKVASTQKVSATTATEIVIVSSPGKADSAQCENTE